MKASMTGDFKEPCRCVGKECATQRKELAQRAQQWECAHMFGKQQGQWIWYSVWGENMKRWELRGYQSQMIMGLTDNVPDIRIYSEGLG